VSARLHRPSDDSRTISSTPIQLIPTLARLSSTTRILAVQVEQEVQEEVAEVVGPAMTEMIKKEIEESKVADEAPKNYTGEMPDGEEPTCR
jgi:hypothetical protein